MSPGEITTTLNTARNTLQPTTASNNAKKSTGRSVNHSKERRTSNIVRITSPLTPWGEESATNKKRKSSIKNSGRQSKSLKNYIKESKKKDQKDNRNASHFQKEEVERRFSTRFRHHSDIKQYMREYRNVRNLLLAAHRDCDCHGKYGPEEIEKAYESLGISKLAKRSRFLTANQTPLLPSVQDDSEKRPNVTENETVLEAGSDFSSEDEEDCRENGLLSPEARERKNKLNLSPLRKQVRLPDMNNYPVQAVSGMNLSELARIATARTNNRSPKDKSDSSTPKLKYSSPERRILTTSLHLQEKTMCRVVELSLPEACEFKVQSEERRARNDEDKLQLRKKIVHLAVKEEEESRDKFALELRSISKVKKLDLGDPQDDALTVAIGTSRSCQSSVLSNAISPLSNSPSNLSPSRVKTVREMLSAAVRELQPFSKNGVNEKQEQTESLSENHSSADSNNNSPLAKQVVSQRTYRNLSQKPSMRRFIEELYVPEAENRFAGEGKRSCHVAGKQLMKLPSLPEPPVPPGPSKKTFLPDKTTDINSTKLLKRIRQRHEVAEAYETLKLAVALEVEKPVPAKLAIVSKCHTVVKPQVSVRGIAL